MQTSTRVEVVVTTMEVVMTTRVVEVMNTRVVPRDQGGSVASCLKSESTTKLTMR